MNAILKNPRLNAVILILLKILEENKRINRNKWKEIVWKLRKKSTMFL